MSLLTVLAGSLLGSIALSLFTLLFHWIFFRPTLYDGQYMFVLFLTIPVGIVLGAMTSTILLNVLSDQRGVAGRIAHFGGIFLLVLFLFLGLFVLSGTGKPTILERLTATLFWFALPLLWAGVFVWIGVRLRSGGAI